MQADAPFPIRDRITNRLGELARLLNGTPSPATVADVRAELVRLSGQR